MDSQSWLIKAPRRAIIDNSGFFNEITGQRLAKVLGIHVARTTVVELDEEFVQGFKGTDLDKYGYESGVGTASEFLPGLMTINASVAFRDEWQSQATLLYAFDMLMANDDRTVKNPNCGVRAGQLVPYDFERIFSGGEQPAWQVSEHPFVSKHLFHPHLTRLQVNWDDFLNSLDGLSHEVVKGQTEDLPSQWATSTRVNKLLRHIEEARANRSKLEEQLYRCLSKPLPPSEVI